MPNHISNPSSCSAMQQQYGGAPVAPPPPASMQTPPVAPMQTPQVAPPRSDGLGRLLSIIAVILSVVALVVSFVVPGAAGPTGPIGLRGQQGLPGTNGTQGQQGPTGPQGPAGRDFTTNTTLLSGQNETGIYSAWGGGVGSYFASNVNFRVPLAVDLPPTNMQFITGAAYTAQCPSPGNATAGFLCVYESFNGNRMGGSIFKPTDGQDGVSRWGFSIYFTATAASSWSYGEWTVTAP